jgi:hypothetical protein
MTVINGGEKEIKKIRNEKNYWWWFFISY